MNNLNNLTVWKQMSSDFYKTLRTNDSFTNHIHLIYICVCVCVCVRERERERERERKRE